MATSPIVLSCSNTFNEGEKATSQLYCHMFIHVYLYIVITLISIVFASYIVRWGEGEGERVKVGRERLPR